MAEDALHKDMYKATKTTEEQEEMNRVSDMYARYQRSEQAFAGLQGQIKKLDMFDRGEQWKDANLPPWIPKPMANWMRYVRTLKRANLASNISSAHMTAFSEENREKVEKIQRAYEHVWRTEKVPRTIRRCIDRAISQGTAIAVVYDEESYGGKYVGGPSIENQIYRGAIRVKRFPIGSFYPDPDAYCLDECKYVDTVENTTLRAVKYNKKFQDYVGKERLMKLTIDMLASTDTERGAAALDREIGPGLGTANNLGDEMITVHTQWEMFITDSGKPQVNCTYYIPNCDFILLEIEDVKPRVYPFAVLYDEEEENSFFGTSTQMDILENQQLINRTAQTASIIGVLNQNPQKVISRDSGIKATDLARTGTMPGKVWTSNGDPAKAIHVVEAQDIPKGLFDLEDRLKNDIREMVGINEAYTGQSVGSLTTSSGVNSLIERATIRDKDKMIQIDDFVEKLSNIIVLFILYKWEDKRPITVKKANGKDSWEEWEPFDETTINNLEWMFQSDVYAVAPTTQALRKQQADNLMQMQGQFNFNPPLITVEEWLRFQDFDMKDQILNRMQADRVKMEKEKAMNTAQMMVQVGDLIRENMMQGMPKEQALQIATQAAQKMLDDEQTAEMSGRPKDAAAQAQGPQGVTGQQAMMAMAKGS